MHLKLGRSRERKRRKPSPPCPHVWESHEEIDRLLESLKSAFVANRVTSVKTTSTMTRQTIETSEERSCSVTAPRAEGLAAPNVQQLALLAAGDGVDFSNTEMGHFRRSEEQKRSGETLHQSPAPAEEEETIYYKSEVNIEHKHATPFPIRTFATTPTPSASGGATSSPAEDLSGSSQSTVVHKRKHVSVRDRAKLLQQKVEEDYNHLVNVVVSQEESANEAADCGDTKEKNKLPLRPEEIPGAVRVLPPMQVGTPSGGSRRASVLRGSSVDSAGFSPPLTLPKFSPFSRRAESQPPPKPAEGVAGAVGPERDEESTTGGGDRRKWVKRSGGEVLRFTRDSRRTSESVSGQTVTTKTDSSYLSRHHRSEKSEPDAAPAFSSAMPSCTTSACSTMERAFLGDTAGFSAATAALLQGAAAECRGRGLATPAYAATDSEVDELTAAPHHAGRHVRSSPQQRMTQGSTSATPNACSAKRPRDGYEADTDDTLARRRRSVREMARCIQEAEDTCPAPKPLRPRTCSESECESDVEFRRGQRSRTLTPVHFTRSRAYVPPKWAPNLSAAAAAATGDPIQGSDDGSWWNQHRQQQQNLHLHANTKVIRVDRQQLVPQSVTDPPALVESAEFVTRMARQVEMERLEAASKRRQTKALSPTLFIPAKFVPGAPTSPRSLLADSALNFSAAECGGGGGGDERRSPPPPNPKADSAAAPKEAAK